MRIEGENIVLRYLNESDSAELLELELRNRDFFKHYLYTVDESYYTIEHQRKIIVDAQQQSEQDQKYIFGVFLKETEQLIGKVILAGVARGSLQSCSLGYYLDQAQNGKGYTTEAVRLAVKVAFEELQLHRIEARIMPKNIGSIRVIEKLGFQKEGHCRKDAYINGKWEDHLAFGLLAEDYVPANQKAPL
ncbi:GNAT family N-acetyltransferase [Desmospora activa]|uniref:Ribosomal-protein-alanine N-acetyltransferase n=1 Tax=Desmospora activa DSM 45169 TaxID=1121389 RepID=A0A2T4Z412_9BACL|nr:GNAT family protein [Desmospora activa]PTM56606.1 ribosomal-protein-alanine N-acetyltransferase [Desmospora activa DSM 45169]